jgi:hypothetical protein
MASAHVTQTHADLILRLQRLANIYLVAVPNVYVHYLHAHAPCIVGHCLRRETKPRLSLDGQNNPTTWSSAKHATALRSIWSPACPKFLTYDLNFHNIIFKKRKTTDKSRQTEDRWHQGWPQLSKSKVITTTWRSYSPLHAVSDYTCWEDNPQFYSQAQILNITVGGNGKSDIRKAGENQPLEQRLHV